MSKKDKVKGFRIARKCWSATEDEALARGEGYCERVGCPYAESDDCTVDIILDATALVEQLWTERKGMKKIVQRCEIRRE